MPVITISDESLKILQSVATPLVDTIDTVIAKLKNGFDASLRMSSDSKDGDKFDHRNPPPLAFANVLSVEIDGEVLPKSETKWNQMFHRLVVVAVEKLGKDEVLSMLKPKVNAVEGEKSDNGYYFLPGAGMSVQGVDSNGAFRNAAYLAEATKTPLKLAFAWQQNDKAAHPGKMGHFEI